MMNIVFATKVKMGQAWTKSGKRLAVTKLKVDNNIVLGEKQPARDGYQAFQIGYGTKKFKNMTKPLRTILTKSGFSLGFKQIREIAKPSEESTMKVGDTVVMSDVLHVGDVVNVQGVTKGRGFAGVMKRHGFHGGPKTHGQSDRARAPGSIGNRTTPGRVFKGKRMAGHYGDVNLTVKNLTVIHLDTQKNEVWLSGPVPGSMTSIVRLSVSGHKEFEGILTAQTPKNEVVEAQVEDQDNAVQVEETVVAEATETK